MVLPAKTGPGWVIIKPKDHEYGIRPSSTHRQGSATRCFAREASGFCFVSGHDFSRATPGQNGEGFSLCHRKIWTKFEKKNPQGLKPNFLARLTRLKSCPDTKQNPRTLRSG